MTLAVNKTTPSPTITRTGQRVTKATTPFLLSFSANLFLVVLSLLTQKMHTHPTYILRGECQRRLCKWQGGLCDVKCYLLLEKWSDLNQILQKHKVHKGLRCHGKILFRISEYVLNLQTFIFENKSKTLERYLLQGFWWILKQLSMLISLTNDFNEIDIFPDCVFSPNYGKFVKCSEWYWTLASRPILGGAAEYPYKCFDRTFPIFNFSAFWRYFPCSSVSLFVHVIHWTFCTGSHIGQLPSARNLSWIWV